MWALPQIFFLRLVADQIVKTNRPVHQRMNRGLSMEWEVRELLGLWLQQLFSLFSGYHASYLAVILSHLNVILFHIYSKISAVFLTMALLFRCLLAYRLKKRRMSACSSCFFLLAPNVTFISFKHQWQSDWAVFFKRCREPAFTGSTKCTIEGGWSHRFVSLVFSKLKVNRK